MNKTPDYLKIDEKHHAEEPFLQQLEELGWAVKHTEQTQAPSDSERENFAQVVLLPELRF